MNQRQRGSVLSYSLIAVLLAILLIGGIVYFKNTSSKTTGPFQPTTEGTTSNSTSTSQNNGSQTAQNDAALKQQSSTQSSNSSSSSSSTSANSSSSTPTTPTAATGSALPTTGPGELIVPFMGVSLLAGFAVAYRRSRLAL